jgi:hypothetical protein
VLPSIAVVIPLKKQVEASDPFEIAAMLPEVEVYRMDN